MKKKNVTIKTTEIKQLLKLSDKSVKVYIALHSNYSINDIIEIMKIQPEELAECRKELNMNNLLPKSPITEKQKILYEAANNSDFANILAQAAENKKKPLDPSQIFTLWECMELGMDTDLLLYLMVTLQQKKKYSEAYFVSIAKTWSQKKILKMEDIKSEQEENNFIFKAVSNAFGLTRAMTPTEAEYVRRWEKHNFNVEIIREACKKTVLITGKISFPYCDKILINWKSKNVVTLSDIEALDRMHKERKIAEGKKKATEQKKAKQDTYGTPKANSFHNFQQRDTNYDEIVQKMVLDRIQNGEWDK